MGTKKVLFLIAFVFLIIGNVLSMDNYIVFQKSDGEVYIIDLNINNIKHIATSKSEITGFEIQGNNIVLIIRNNPNITITDATFKGLIENRKPQNSIKVYEVKTDGNSISLFANSILKWKKIHAYKSFYAKNEGYNNASISNTHKRIVCERNWLGFFGFFNPSNCSNKTIVEIDIDTQKENLICKNCSFPIYSPDGEYILCKETDAQKYSVIKVVNNEKIELECINAFWIY